MTERNYNNFLFLLLLALTFTAAAVDELCDTRDTGCPVARCLSPPPNCRFQFDHYIVTESGKSCASLCYAVDNTTGEPCSSQKEEPEPEEPCDTNPDNTGCPMAKCASPPQNCSYQFDHFVVTESGKCCASMCFAVDDTTGNQCTTDPPTLMSSCTPLEGDATRCPVAMCATAPPGCTYTNGPGFVTETGDCCRQQCYAVDSSSGEECLYIDDSHENTDDSGVMFRMYVSLLSILVPMGLCTILYSSM